MAQTRGATGHSKPRVFATVSTEPVRKRKTTTATTTGGATKKRKTASKKAGVTKTRAPATHHKRKPTIVDKIEGAVEKVVGIVEGKPGKKAAGTKKMRGTDGKGGKVSKTAKVEV
ncbi:uncharacterized protein PV07_10105 [Cladophialophora immunda]|uniref:Uncharacterized protein n=1 Tax=Cladophialophora immunda TaxID=569365 RepID=A0A0D2AHK9_9EURO|nr:uncharacterized protein PV07_10105 [Cladophialophora immunda]KIW24387.1 hypothetical protein PV07_10105 [Cladophialophora immunda]OQU97959.1 hypothetical protein CLAIMM_03812 [Cladophialophora immunda]